MEKYKAVEFRSDQSDSLFKVLDMESLNTTSKVYSFMSEAQEAANELNAKESQEQFEKVECSIWRLEKVCDYFHQGLMYYLDGGDFLVIGDVIELSKKAHVGNLYRKLEKPTLDMELGDLGFEVCNQKFIYDGDGSAFSFESIHKLSEILKRHGK